MTPPTTVFIAGTNTAADEGFFAFFTGQIVNNGDVEPSFVSPSRILQMSDVSILANRDLNMDLNNINGVNRIDSTNPQIYVDKNLDLNTNDLLNVDIGAFLTRVQTPLITSSGVSTLFGKDVNLQNNDILGVDNIYSSNYNIVSPLDQRARYSITGRAISADTDTLLASWTIGNTSTRVQFDETTGVFSPEAGFYTIAYNNNITTTTGNINMGWRIVDDLGNTGWVSVVRSDALYQAETGFEGSQYETVTVYFDGIRTYTIHTKLNTAETCNFSLCINRVF